MATFSAGPCTHVMHELFVAIIQDRKVRTRSPAPDPPKLNWFKILCTKQCRTRASRSDRVQQGSFVSGHLAALCYLHKTAAGSHLRISLLHSDAHRLILPHSDFDGPQLVRSIQDSTGLSFCLSLCLSECHRTLLPHVGCFANILDVHFGPKSIFLRPHYMTSF